ncbi:unnamed protein product, partial [Ectocarpus sp. 12 AP-2014]
SAAEKPRSEGAVDQRTTTLLVVSSPPLHLKNTLFLFTFLSFVSWVFLLVVVCFVGREDGSYVQLSLGVVSSNHFKQATIGGVAFLKRRTGVTMSCAGCVCMDFCRGVLR